MLDGGSARSTACGRSPGATRTRARPAHRRRPSRQRSRGMKRTYPIRRRLISEVAARHPSSSTTEALLYARRPRRPPVCTRHRLPPCPANNGAGETPACAALPRNMGLGCLASTGDRCAAAMSGAASASAHVTRTIVSASVMTRRPINVDVFAVMVSVATGDGSLGTRHYRLARAVRQRSSSRSHDSRTRRCDWSQIRTIRCRTPVSGRTAHSWGLGRVTGDHTTGQVDASSSSSTRDRSRSGCCAVDARTQRRPGNHSRTFAGFDESIVGRLRSAGSVS